MLMRRIVDSRQSISEMDVLAISQGWAFPPLMLDRNITHLPEFASLASFPVIHLLIVLM